MSEPQPHHYRFTPDTEPYVLNNAVHCSHNGHCVIVHCSNPIATADSMGPDCTVEIVIDKDRLAGCITGHLVTVTPSGREWTVGDALGLPPQ